MSKKIIQESIDIENAGSRSSGVDDVRAVGAALIGSAVTSVEAWLTYSSTKCSNKTPKFTPALRASAGRTFVRPLALR